MKHVCIKIVMALLIPFVSMSFTRGQTLNSIPPSPEAAAIIRSINIPVNLNTGVANVQVPIYTITEGKLTIPIALSYQTSGIKVQDIATWVGLGWRLNGGGQVTRVLKKEPDENGFCKGTGTESDGYEAMITTDWTEKFNERLDGTFDAEPDVFYFEVPGHSGMFIVDHEGNPCIIPYQNIDIKWINKSYFKITDEQGTVYTLGSTVKESMSIVESWGEHKTKGPYTSTWHLEKIESFDGNVINYSYTTGTNYSYTNYDSYINFIFSINKEGGTFDPTKGYIRDENVHDINTVIYMHSPRYLNTISWKGGKMEFITSADRQDLINGRKLNEIKIYSGTTDYLKSILLRFDNRGGDDYRLFLESIYEQNASKRLPICFFDYNRKLTPRSSKAFDHWGYANGVTSNSNIPSGDYWGVQYNGISREPNFQHTMNGILTRIHYNTGGITEFEYELNEGYLKYHVEKKKCGGLRIKSIKKISSDTLTTKYYYTPFRYPVITPLSGSSGEIFNGLTTNLKLKGSSSFDNNGNRMNYGAMCTSKSKFDLFDVNGSPVLYSTVIVEEPNGIKNVYEYTSSDTTIYHCNDILSTITWIDYFLNGTFLNSSGIFRNSSQFWKRGLLLKQSTYSKDGYTLLKEDIYEYSLDKSIKKVIKGYEQNRYPLSLNLSIGSLCSYQWIQQPIYLNRIKKNKGTLNIEQIIETDYDTVTLLPREIRTKEVAMNTIYKTRIKYPRDFKISSTISPNDTVPYSLTCFVPNHMLAFPVEVVTYKNDTVIEGNIQEYKTSRGKPLLYKTKSLCMDKPKTSYTAYYYNPQNRTMTSDKDYELTSIYEEYDALGHVTQQREAFQNPVSTVYGYNNSLPIAIVKNATSKNEIFYTSFEDDPNAVKLNRAKTGNKVYNKNYSIDLSSFKPGTYILTYWKTIDNGQTWIKQTRTITINSSVKSYSVECPASCYIDELRIIPPNAMINTISYLPGVGITSETDHNGITTYYEYDVFGRLTTILDNDRNKLKSYQYITH